MKCDYCKKENPKLILEEPGVRILTDWSILKFRAPLRFCRACCLVLQETDTGPDLREFERICELVKSMGCEDMILPRHEMKLVFSQVLYG